MDRERRVCCFCEKWASGGIESFLLGTMEAMDRQGLSFRIVTARQESELYLPRMERLGISLVQLSGSTKRLLKNHAQFRRLLRQEQFDTVHLNVYHALSGWYAWDCKRARVPVILVHGHGPALRRSPTRPLKQLLHALSRRVFDGCSTKRIACSKPVAEFQFPKNRPVTILHNGIDLQKFAFSRDARERLRRELGLTDELVVGTVGRLEREKNQTFLLHVFAELLRLAPNSILLLAGEGEDRTELEQTALGLGIAAQVRFLGTREDIPALLSAMDLFALPSVFEGLGIAALEAQAAGLPTVLSTGIPEETAVCGQALRLPLELGPGAWAENLLTLSKLPRRTMADPALAAGFDRTETARQLRSYYLGE